MTLSRKLAELVPLTTALLPRKLAELVPLTTALLLRKLAELVALTTALLLRKLAVLVLLMAALSSAARGATAAEALTRNDDFVRKGEYLSRAADCGGCHTVDPAKPFAGGYRVPTPFGDIVASNITPDSAHGIGDWSEDDFVRALQSGLRPDGSHLYPAMPYDSYTLMSRDDILAIRAYLMAQRPIGEAAPSGTLAFPFNQRWLLWGWKLVNFRDARFVARSDKDEEWNRGAYLVEALAHCGTCHTPRTLTLGTDAARTFAGGAVGPWQAYNISSDPVAGIGGWSESDLVRFLSTGAARGFAYAGGPMAEAVEHGLRYLDDDDLQAMATYLRDARPMPEAGVDKARYNFGRPSTAEISFRGTVRLSDDPVRTGAELYSGACASCHGSDGSGSADGAFPALFHNTATGGSSPANLVMTILNGVERHSATGAVFMPAFRQRLADPQVAALADFVAKSFGNPAATTTPELVAALRRGEAPGGFGATLRTIAPTLGLAFLAGLVALLFLLMRRRHAPAPA